MEMAVRKKDKTFNAAAAWLILPLALVNVYAYWRLSRAAGHWSLSLIPNGIADILTQLALILAVNNIVIVGLLIYIKFRK